MPRDLFGDIVHPAARVGSRSWYTLPLSFVMHTLALGALVIVPLMATGVLPAPHHVLPEFLQVVPDVPPEPPPVRTAAPTAPRTVLTANPDAAPLDAPAGVRDEPGIVEPEPGHAGVPGGLPEGIAGSILNGLPDAPPPPAVDAPVAPIRVSQMRAPAKVHHVSPVYPAIAQQARVQGTVILEAIIDPSGTVKDARVLRSIALLDQAALEAVRQWVFTPTLLNGVPVPVVMTVTVTFTLK
jgi:protein TonB